MSEPIRARASSVGGPIRPGGIGQTGAYSTVRIGEVFSVSPDTPPRVENVGTLTDAILNFYLQRGRVGERGPRGREVELRYDGSAEKIEWRYAGDTEWTELMDIDELKTEVEAQIIAEAEAARDAAEGYAGAAEESATASSESATAAAGSATTASGYASTASAKATEASASAESAEESADTASTKATAASASASAAAACAAAASDSADDASASADAASGYATSASGYASTASTEATAAASSAQSASQSASAAAQSATDAEESAALANTSAESAESSADAAATSETNAESSASAAAASASSAATSETNAGAHETAASASATAADNRALDSEAWSVGQRGGVDVPSSDETYHNNAKYWSDQAAQAAGGGVSSFNGRSGAVLPQSGDYTAAMVGADASGAAAAVQTNLNAVTDKISSAASSTNKLVSASEMGDAIAAVEAKQLYKTSAQGSFATKAELTSATTFYNADGTSATPTKNDVAYVLADESHDDKSAKYVISNEPNGGAIVWGFVIAFSDVTFTQTQMDAVNSGITSAKVSGYDAHVNSSSNPHGVTYQQLGGTKPTYTAAEVGARADDWMPTAAQVGARPDTWVPTAAQVGARADTWTPTAAQVGALPTSALKTATVSLTTSGWSGNVKTVSVTGVTDSNTVIVSPAAASIQDWSDAGVRCTAQGSGTLTFTRTGETTATITVDVVLLTN